MMRLKLFRSNTEEDSYLHFHDTLPANDSSLSQPAFAHANTEPRRWRSPHHSFSRSSSKNATATSGSVRAHRHRLSSVIQLFEDGIVEHPSYKMKANGAIVMNRTYHPNKSQEDDIGLLVSTSGEGSTHSDFSTSSSTSHGRETRSWGSEAAASSDDDDDDEEENEDAATDIVCFPLPTTPLNPPPRPSHVSNKKDVYLDACEALTSSYSKEFVDLVLLENQRLRDQLSLERQENRTQILKSNDALASARRETRYLRRILSYTRILNADKAGGKRRRQSTGGSTASSLKRELGMNSLSPFCRAPAMSHEHKLKILLDEIEAMHLEDDQLQAKLDQVQKKNTVLKQALSDKDETIRQLKFDIQMEALKK